MIRNFAAALLLLGTLLFSDLAGAQTAPVTTQIRVGGQVIQKTDFDLSKLKSLPVATANVTYIAAGATTSHSFTGALLWDVLQSVGVITDQTVKNDILRKVVVVTGSDGYKVIFSLGEIDPFFGGNQVIVAYKQDGQLLGTDGVARVVAPGDKAGGRFVSNVAKIAVRDASQ